MNTFLLVTAICLIAVAIMLLVRKPRRLTESEAASVLARAGAAKRAAAEKRKIDATSDRLRSELGR